VSAAGLVPALCRWLALTVPGVVFDETGSASTIFDTRLPQTPDEIVSVRDYGGPTPDSLQGWDEVYVQIRTRGPKDDPRPSRTRIHAIRDALEGATNVTLPGGPFVVLVHSLQPPFAMDGVDSQGRYEHVLNVSIEVRNVAGHRV
jgi:hypothetical protein